MQQEHLNDLFLLLVACQRRHRQPGCRAACAYHCQFLYYDLFLKYTFYLLLVKDVIVNQVVVQPVQRGRLLQSSLSEDGLAEAQNLLPSCNSAKCWGGKGDGSLCH